MPRSATRPVRRPDRRLQPAHGAGCEDRRVFDTLFGLPLHVLVVHAVVVLLPLMAAVTVLLSVRPRWSSAVGWAVVAADGALVLVTLVAKQSGEALQRRLGPLPAIQRHAAWGETMPWMALGLLVVAVLVMALRRRGGVRVGLPAVTLVVAGVVVYWTVRTGDSGARAVWQDIVTNTTPK